MPFGDRLNWDFLLSQFTDKQREEILQREEMLRIVLEEIHRETEEEEER